MALVAFLKGVNVGGHRTFRPSALAQELKQFDVLNVGAAGTFVVRQPVSRADLRAEIARRLPFQAHVIICNATDILRLAASDPFTDHVVDAKIVQFVSVMAQRRKLPSVLPLDLPTSREWCVRVLACRGQFVLGLYSREMRTIGHLGQLEKLMGVPLATRNWNTVLTIARGLRQ